MQYKLKIVRMSSESKDTRDGTQESESVRLEGYDDIHRVEWALILKAKDELPDEYAKTIGKQVGDSVLVTIGESIQQSSLEGGG